MMGFLNKDDVGPRQTVSLAEVREVLDLVFVLWGSDLKHSNKRITHGIENSGFPCKRRSILRLALIGFDIRPEDGTAKIQ